MPMNSLFVIHLPQEHIRYGAWNNLFKQKLTGTLELETCERHLWILSGVEAPDFTDLWGIEVFQGVEAYRFLLSLCCGLQSELTAETEVLRQFKKAWNEFQSRDNSGFPVSTELCQMMIPRILEDAKEIRHEYLKNVSSSSYGSLVRFYLRKLEKPLRSPILMVGSGQLASSVLPWIINEVSELWLAARNPMSLEKMLQNCRKLPNKPPRLIESGALTEEKKTALMQARHVIYCIPKDENFDPERVKSFLSGGSLRERTVLHLGGRKRELGAFELIPNLADLDSVHQMKKIQQDNKLWQIEQAKTGCEERSRIRAQGLSVAIPQGCEDLAYLT